MSPVSYRRVSSSTKRDDWLRLRPGIGGCWRPNLTMPTPCTCWELLLISWGAMTWPSN